MNNRIIGVLFLALTLAGCSSSSKKHLTPLPEVVLKSPPIRAEWHTHVLSSSDYRKGLNLQPAADPYFVYSADSSGMVVAQDLDTGRVVWRLNTHLPLTAGPVLHGHSLIVGSNDGDVWVLDTSKEGAIQWKATVSSSVLAKPIVDDKQIYIQTNDSEVTALNLETGAILWAVEQSQPALILRGTSAPAVFGQTLFVGTHDGKLVALHKETGALIWDKSVSTAKGRSEVERMVDVVSDIRADDATIFIAGYQGRVAAINSQTGNMEWQRDLSVHEDFSVDKKALYLTDSTGVLIALDKVTGATLWQQDVLKGRRPSGPLVCPPYLLVGDAGGYWHWFNLGDGARVAAKEMGDGIVAMPLKAGPWVVGLSQDGTLTAVKQ